MPSKPPEAQAILITMTEKVEGKPVHRLAMDAWPVLAIISPAVTSLGFVQHRGDLIRIELANGWALYRPTLYLPRGEWECVLEGSYLQAAAAEQGIDPARTGIGASDASP